ncbi:MAG TPA: DUF3857 domain-containing protein [Terriglobales bacterium]|nr:DUF3857 domain-containing protein [Terriglobales bacterium]
MVVSGALWVLFLRWLAPASVLFVQAPSSNKAEEAKNAYPQEALVIEQFSRKQRFENDGSASQEDTARVRIQSDAGLQRYGLLTFSYPSATGTFEIGYVRVRKPDGTVVETPPESVQDMAAQITREAPFYSDLHEKHVAVKGLSVGDVLEFRVEERTTKPLVPGQFWTDYHFTNDVVVLEEQLEISVPRERTVKVKSATVQPVVHDQDGYRVYTWHHSNLEHNKDTNDRREATRRALQQMRGRLPQPDVLVSSFASWEEVGRWYGGLQEERVKLTPEIAAKAAELTKGAGSDDKKIQALYSYVSTQFHYIGVAFGIGRYQSHSATEVLANQYGDCKDKHTLLASLLTASGIPAYPALISSSREVDADVPSPGQFDHVITVVPQAANLLWLDSTPEVGPYRYLLPPLRDKQALLILKDKPVLVKTPADLPYETTQTFHMDAKLNDAGTLEGRADFSVRGDLEYLLRAGFRAVPLPQWNDLMQRLSLSLGFGGEVSEATASSPEKTDEPFRLAWKYNRKEFGDWANRRILAPSPLIAFPAEGDQETLPPGPIWLGSLSEIQFDTQMALPVGYQPTLPAAVHLKKDFAQYDATYEFKDGQLIGQRHAKTLLQEVPASEREEYIRFVKAVQDDYGAYIPLSEAGSEVAAVVQNPSESTINAVRNLPDSSNTEAVRLENEARTAMLNHDLQTAVSSLYRAVAADPKFTRAWVMLGTLLLTQKQVDAGVDAFHKAIAADPTQPAIAKFLGLSLMRAQQFDQAVPVWQDYGKAHPDDVDAVANLAQCLIRLKRYSDAAAVYETAAQAHADRAEIQAGLASVYLLADARAKAGAVYEKLAAMHPSNETLNDAAYEMANADLKLPLALDYAKKAVRGAEEESQKITLADLTMEDVRNIFKVSAYWDTLGWANERMSNLDVAEQYLRASWRLTQDGLVAGHLCHLYDREHKVGLAIEMCRAAIDRIPMRGGSSQSEGKAQISEARRYLDRFPKAGSTVEASNLVVRQRTFKLGRFLPGTESAEFFLLLGSDGARKTFRVEDVKFVSGSDKMKHEGRQLKSIDFGVPAPSDVPVRFVWRGILGCYQYSGCSFVVLDPMSVHSLN